MGSPLSLPREIFPMEKLIPDHRRMLDGFELIDFVDTDEIERLRNHLEVDAATNVNWQWEYGSEVAELRALYEKGKTAQWNASTDLDWSIPVSKDDWVLNPEGSLFANVLKMMGKDEATQKAAAFDELAFTVSQLLHGQQAPLEDSHPCGPGSHEHDGECGCGCSSGADLFTVGAPPAAHLTSTPAPAFVPIIDSAPLRQIAMIGTATPCNRRNTSLLRLHCALIV